MNPFGRSLFIMVLIHFFGSHSLTLRQVCIVFLWFSLPVIFLCSVMVPVEVEEGEECCSLLSPLHFLCTLGSMLTPIGMATLTKFFTPQMWHLFESGVWSQQKIVLTRASLLSLLNLKN